MKIRVDWDSGPYGIYLRDNGRPSALQGGAPSEVPDEVFERYERAEAELLAAEEALESAIEERRAQLRQKDEPA